MVFGRIDTQKEDRDYLQEVEEVKKWWSSTRFRKIKRYPAFFNKLMVLDRIRLRVLLPRGGL